MNRWHSHVSKPQITLFSRRGHNAAPSGWRRQTDCFSRLYQIFQIFDLGAIYLWAERPQSKWTENIPICRMTNHRLQLSILATREGSLLKDPQQVGCRQQDSVTSSSGNDRVHRGCSDHCQPMPLGSRDPFRLRAFCTDRSRKKLQLLLEMPGCLKDAEII